MSFAFRKQYMSKGRKGGGDFDDSPDEYAERMDSFSDPTARVSSHVDEKRISPPYSPPKSPLGQLVSAIDSAVITEDTANVPARRVQIYNQSETFAPDGTLELVVFSKSEETKACLFGALLDHFLFESLSEEDLIQIVDCMSPLSVSEGDIIITEGEAGDLFYCLETGVVSACVLNVGEVMKYESGGCFGELALLYNCPRAASVNALTDCSLWTLDLKTFRNILATTSSSTMAVRCEFLKHCPFLEPLTNKQISRLAGALEISYYEAGDFILRQGDYGDSFFIIEEGTVKCTQIKSSGREFELISLKAGDYFGEMALMLNEMRHANCIAVTRVKCLSLNREKFDILMGQARQLMARRMRIRILQSVPLLAKLTETKLLKLAGVMKVQSFPEGTYIIKEGEEGSRFYIINEGEVRCTVSSKTPFFPDEEIVRLYPQEFFGERALVTKEARTANVIACGTVECLVLDRNSFETLLQDVHNDISDEMLVREASDAKRRGSDESGSGQNKSHAQEEESSTTGFTDYKLEDLIPLRTVGTGTFGRVKLVQHASDGGMYALKCMNKSEIVALHQERNTLAEKNLLHDCARCPFILQLLQTFNRPNQIFMLTEFIQGGELWSYIYEKRHAVPRAVDGGFEMSAVQFYAANVVLAFKHMHSRGIAYRDLKPENLLLNHDGYIKVIDFGFAKMIPYNKRGVELDKTYTLCGTPEYLAPEIILSKGYDKNVDYWALGCLIYEMIYSHTPFQAEYTSKIFRHIIASEKYLRFGLKGSEGTVAVIRGLLCPNPSFRLGNLSAGIKGIIEHPFFNTIDWIALSKRQSIAPFVPKIGGEGDSSNFGTYDEETVIPEYTGSQEYFESF